MDVLVLIDKLDDLVHNAKTVRTIAGAWVLPAMLVIGALGGRAYALIPALLRVRFGVSEILTSLMLVYVADLALDYLVRGPWRDPRASTSRRPSASTRRADADAGRGRAAACRRR